MYTRIQHRHCRGVRQYAATARRWCYCHRLLVVIILSRRMIVLTFYRRRRYGIFISNNLTCTLIISRPFMWLYQCVRYGKFNRQLDYSMIDRFLRFCGKLASHSVTHCPRLIISRAIILNCRLRNGAVSDVRLSRCPLYRKMHVEPPNYRAERKKGDLLSIGAQGRTDCGRL